MDTARILECHCEAARRQPGPVGTESRLPAPRSEPGVRFSRTGLPKARSRAFADDHTHPCVTRGRGS